MQPDDPDSHTSRLAAQVGPRSRRQPCDPGGQSKGSQLNALIAQLAHGPAHAIECPSFKQFVTDGEAHGECHSVSNGSTSTAISTPRGSATASAGRRICSNG